ncbi:MAG: PorT family protein [Fibromonadales bacterium]|nr:PorT family protein [Fibromonadales bacterium]
MRKAIIALLFAASIGIAQDFGIRSGLGASALRGHKAIQSLAFGPNAIRLYPNFSASAGLVFAFEANEFFSIVPELQYTLYQAKGYLVLKTGMDSDDLYEAGVILHSLELPILMRFSIGRAYVEAGPQVGANLYAKLYQGNELKKPDVNILAFGPSVGTGIKIRNNILLGVRGHFGLLEYAKKMNGHPWTAQIGVSVF